MSVKEKRNGGDKTNIYRTGQDRAGQDRTGKGVQDSKGQVR